MDINIKICESSLKISKKYHLSQGQEKCVE